MATSEANCNDLRETVEILKSECTQELASRRTTAKDLQLSQETALFGLVFLSTSSYFPTNINIKIWLVVWIIWIMTFQKQLGMSSSELTPSFFGRSTTNQI
jgi:hypothetical protein